MRSMLDTCPLGSHGVPKFDEGPYEDEDQSL